MENKYMRVQANINLDNIYHNLSEVKKKIGDKVGLIAVIKADGYGHGAVEIAQTCDEIIDWYAVAVVEEAIELRNQGLNKPTLLLGFTHPDQYEDLLRYNLMPTIFSFDMAEKLSEVATRMNKTAKIHIKLDTGMSRIGFDCSENSVDTVVAISKLPNIEIDGMFTHFACADCLDKTFAKEQFSRFMDFNKRLNQKGVKIENLHVANSAAIMEMKETHLKYVRSGIVTYGLYPSDEVDMRALDLKPAMELKSTISYIKTLEPGVTIGYGATFTTCKKTVVATVPVGYADGYPRSLSNVGEVLVKGKRARIIGRVCMDQFMIDVTDIPNVQPLDTVTLVGRDGIDFMSVEEVANKAGSFNYEFVCDVSKRVPRVYYKGGEIVDIKSFV